MKNLLLFFLLLTLSWNAQALKQEDLLPPDKAFQFSASPVDKGLLRLTWDIAEGYYLYRDRLAFSTETTGIELKTDSAVFPTGDIKNDPNFGEMEVYHKKFSIDLPIERNNTAQQALELQLKTKYQGCADAGLCYPPQRKTVNLKLAALTGNSSPDGSSTLDNIPAKQKDTPSQIPLKLLDKPKPLTKKIAGNKPLPVDQAFQYALLAVDQNTLSARWEITPGHHLYRSKVKFNVLSPEGVELGTAVFPKGQVIDDEFFGKMEIYDQALAIQIPLTTKAKEVTIETQYQGCSNTTGICYPPVTQQSTLSLLNLPQYTASPTASDSQGSDTSLTDQFFSGSFLRTLIAFFVIGLGLSLTPCIFPMIPILSGIIAGQTNLSASKAFILSLTYVIASATAYALIGLVFGFFGENLQSSLQHPIVIGLFVTLFVVLSLSMFGFFDLQMPSSIQSRLNEISNNQRSGSLLGAAIMGFLSTLIVGPCVAPALAAALTYIANTKDAILGASALFSMGFGMGVILLVVGTLGGHLLPRAGTWMDTTKAIFGIMLLGMAIWMLDRIVPLGITMMLTGVLLVSSGIYMGALDKLHEEAGGWDRFWKSIGLILLFYGAAQLFGVAAGSNNILQPLRGVFSAAGAVPAVPAGAAVSNTQAHQGLNFRRIKSNADLDGILEQARQSKTRVMLDFYADWCLDCIRMEKDVFTADSIKTALNGVILLQADVTRRDADDRALEKRLGIIGPPTIIFFDENGREIKNIRMIGYENIPMFAKRLQNFRAN